MKYSQIFLHDLINGTKTAYNGKIKQDEKTAVLYFDNFKLTAEKNSLSIITENYSLTLEKNKTHSFEIKIESSYFSAQAVCFELDTVLKPSIKIVVEYDMIFDNFIEKHKLLIEA